MTKNQFIDGCLKDMKDKLSFLDNPYRNSVFIDVDEYKKDMTNFLQSKLSECLDEAEKKLINELVSSNKLNQED